MKELPEAVGTSEDCMLLTAWVVFNLGAGIQEWTRGSLKSHRAHLPPPPKLKGSDQFPPKIQSSEFTETTVGCKWESLRQQFASPFVYLRLHLFPSFSHPGALFQRPLPWSVSKSLARSKLLTPVFLPTPRLEKRGQGPSWGKRRALTSPLPKIEEKLDRLDQGNN